MKNLKNHRLFIFILFIAVVFRLGLSRFGDNHDLLTNAGWGEWIYKNGAKGFYENSTWIYSWPTQLPLINLIYGFNYYLFDQKLLWFFSYIEAVIKSHQIFPQFFSWWFNFVNWFGTKLFQDTPFRNGFLISMKLIPILADLIIASIIYLVGRKIVGINKSLVVSSLFLFIPFSWYTSSLWGQYDQLSTLFLLSSFLMLYKRFFLISSIFLLLSIQVKPTSIFLTPFYIYYFFYLKPSIKSVLLSIIANTFILLALTYQFTDKNPFFYTFQSIYPKVFNNDRFGLVNHAFNFWQMISPSGGWSTTFHLLGLSALVWGIAFLIIINAVAIITFHKNPGFKGLMLAFYLIAAGSYLFATGMVDRYFYPAIVFLGVLTLYYKKLFKWWILTCLIFSINLFYSWGFPILNDLTAWKSELIIRFFSFLNIVVFLICAKKMGVKLK